LVSASSPIGVRRVVFSSVLPPLLDMFRLLSPPLLPDSEPALGSVRSQSQLTSVATYWNGRLAWGKKSSSHHSIVLNWELVGIPNDGNKEVLDVQSDLKSYLGFIRGDAPEEIGRLRLRRRRFSNGV